MASVDLAELLELAISSQDVGTVNFNMLRLLLDDVIKKLTKTDNEPVQLGDHDANQVANYKSYIEGAPVSPMPGILRYTPSSTTGKGPHGKDGLVKQPSGTPTPRTPKSERPPAPVAQVGGSGGGGNPPGPSQEAKPAPGVSGPGHGGQTQGPEQASRPTKPHITPRPGSFDHGPIKEIQDKIEKLEKQLHSMNQLPDNEQLLHKTPKDKDGMSVNDMWQLIQLNNRIAAAEAGLQKMASLIEDLAKELNKVRSATSVVQTDTDSLAKSNSDLAMQVGPLTDKHVEADKKIKELKSQIDEVKTQLELLESATGLDPNKAPSFMKKEKKPHSKTPKKDKESKDSKEPKEHKEPKESKDLLEPKDINDTKDPKESKGTTGPTQGGEGPGGAGPGGAGSGGTGTTPGPGETVDPGAKMKTLTPDEIAGLSNQELAKLTSGQLTQLSASQIASLTPSQVSKITPSQMKELTPERREQLQKLKKDAHSKHRPPPDINTMEPHQISSLTSAQLKKMTPSDIAQIRPSKLAQLNSAQLKQLERIKSKGPDLNGMTPGEISKLPVSELEKLSRAQISKLTPSALESMTPEQRKQVEKMKKSKGKPQPDGSTEKPTESQKEIMRQKSRSPGPHKDGKEPGETDGSSVAGSDSVTAADLSKMNPDQIALIPIDDLKKLTPEEVDKIRPSLLALMTSEQRLRLEEVKNGKFKAPDFNELTPEEIAAVSMSKLSLLTPSQIENISEEVKAQMTDEQRAKLEEILLAGKNYGHVDRETGPSDSDSIHTGSQETETTEKKRQKAIPQRFRGKKKEPAGGTEEPGKEGGNEDMMEKEEALEVPKPALGEHLEIMTMESYLASLPKEEVETIASDAVEKELQRQYAELQGMQRKLAQDIQDKMEIIYQKLLKEIIEQQLTSSPYTVIDGQEKCLGPGICKGHGMPAGIAACQYPDPNDKRKSEKPAKGAAACPDCGNDALKNLKPPRLPQSESVAESIAPSGKPSSLPPSAEKPTVADQKSMMVLDLDKIRDDMKSSSVAFNEKDIMERLGTLWEAVKLLKTNEDALSTRLTQHETLLKTIPSKAMERNNKPDAKSEAKLETEYVPSKMSTNLKDRMQASVSAAPIPSSKTVENEADQNEKDETDKDDVQTLFNNLANVISECADQKERIDQLVDAVRIIESGMVTKQILTDSMSDKADRGQINTKVSYDEFGNTVDELHTQLHNLMVEGYQRNENWKKVTADLAEELAEKLDKVELAPIRAFFKSRLKHLEDRMQTLSTLLEEPDPAGTRKKLLRDYNCISCDRRVNISGITNAPILPTIGPSMATSASPSHRALDLHRLRSQRSRFDADAREIAALEKKVSSQNSGLQSERSDRMLSDKDMMQMVNRYVGSKPTSRIGAMRVASQAQKQMSQAQSTQMAPASSMHVQVSQSQQSQQQQLSVEEIEIEEYEMEMEE